MNFWRAFMLMWLAVSLAGCGINNIPTYDEQVKAAWSQVQNQYQRRADLVPNLVNTVQGFADQEREVLVGGTEARSQGDPAVRGTPARPSVCPSAPPPVPLPLPRRVEPRRLHLLCHRDHDNGLS